MKNTAKNTLSIYWHHAKKYPLSLAVSLLFLPIVIAAGSVGVPLIYSDAIDRLATASSFSEFKGSLLLAAALFTVVFFGWRVIGFTWSRFEFMVMRDITRRIFDWLEVQSYQFHVNSFGGALVAQTKRFVGAFERLADAIYFNIGMLLFRFIFSTIALLFIAPIVSLVLFVWTSFFIASIIYLSYRKRHLAQAASAADSKTTARLADVVTNILNVKIFASENTEQKDFNEVTQSQYKKGLKDWYFSEGIYAWQSFLMIMLELTVLSLSIHLVTSDQLTVGRLVLIQFFMFPIMGGLWEASRVARTIERSLADAVEMTKVLFTQPTITDPRQPEECLISEGKIEFSKMGFSYEDQVHHTTKLFKNFSLTIKSGEKVGLVGPSGGGKTTITKLLLRFMDLSSGAIKIDDQDISKITQADLRKNIAYVPQEPILFHRTLMENIRYSKPDATDEEIVTAAKLAHAHEFIMRLGDQYETLVGERGVKLSGGEKQRVSIARAILKDAPILVLDEATSALDSESEKYIQDALAELMKGRTAIVIAHRLSTVQKMDRIVVLEDGKVSEEGTHSQLTKNKGKYSELWQHQSGAFLE